MSIQEQVEQITKNETLTKRKKEIELLKIEGLTKQDVKILLSFCTDNAPIAANVNVIKKLTFGVEIECYNAPRTALIQKAAQNNLRLQSEGYNHIDNRHHFKLVSDASIRGENPVECVSPILSNNKSGFDALKNCCDTLEAVGAKVNKSTGLHVHVGGLDAGEWYVNVFKNYQKAECLIDNFMAQSRRANNAFFAKSIQDANFGDCHTSGDVYLKLRGDRYRKVNPCAWGRHGTIEFRQHQGSIDYEKISMWVAFCLKLVAWSKNNTFENCVTTIDELVFLSKKEKDFFKSRAEALSNN